MKRLRRMLTFGARAGLFALVGLGAAARAAAHCDTMDGPVVASARVALRDVVPKARACRGFEKLREPNWGRLQESVSFISAEREPSGQTEALLSFWGEPFMAKTASREVPRYIFHVQGHSELVARLLELAREYRFRT